MTIKSRKLTTAEEPVPERHFEEEIQQVEKSVYVITGSLSMAQWIESMDRKGV
jgi:hypothetical protein